MATFQFDAENRTPWNNKIFPGNYVAHLNAYRDQGVVATPWCCVLPCRWCTGAEP